MKRHRAGFTLVEVLVVLAVAGLVLLVLGQGLRISMRGTATYRRSVQPQQDMVPVERALRGMFERADPGFYPNLPLARGTAHSFVFTTDVPDPSAGTMRRADVRLDVEAGHLVLWWTPHTHGMPFGAPPPPEREVLLDRVARLDVAYVARDAPDTWVSAWTKPYLPARVRLTVTDGEGGMSWPPVIVALPREQAEE